MKIGFFAIGMGRLAEPEWIRLVATNVERLGFSSLWAPEHVVLLDDFASRYPYSEGEFPVPTDTPIGDPFPTLTYAAACTNRIRLATGICLVPEHNPLDLAKTVATVDRLSTGRFDRMACGGVRGIGHPVRTARTAYARIYRGDAQAMGRRPQFLQW